MVLGLLRYYEGALTALGTPTTSDTLIGRCPLKVTKSSRRVTHTGYDAQCLTLHAMNRIPRCRGRQGCLTPVLGRAYPFAHGFPVGRLTSPSMEGVWGSAEYAASPVHPAASAFSIAFSTYTSRIGTSRLTLSPSSRASRHRPRCILCDINHCAALICPTELLDVQHPVWACPPAHTLLPEGRRLWRGTG